LSSVQGILAPRPSDGHRESHREEKGGNAVLPSEKDEESLLETIDWMSSKETREEIFDGLKALMEDGIEGDEVDLSWGKQSTRRLPSRTSQIVSRPLVAYS